MSDDLTEMPAVPPMPEGPPMPDAASPLPAPPPAARAARRWVLPLAAGVAGLVVGAGGVGAVWGMSGADTPPVPVAFTLRGTMTLTGDNVLSGDTSEECTGYSGYDDIAAGTSVTVYDSAGKVVAEGSLGAGTPDSTGAACVFPVTVTGVPGGAKFYQVEISHRGKLTVSSAEAKAGGFASSLG